MVWQWHTMKEQQTTLASDTPPAHGPPNPVTHPR
jgi:hypothetical protein